MPFRIAPRETGIQQRPGRFPKPNSLSDDWVYACLRPRLFSRHGGLLRFHGLNNRVGEFRGAGGAAYVPGEFAAVAVDLVDGVADLPGRVGLAEMAQHK